MQHVLGHAAWTWTSTCYMSMLHTHVCSTCCKSMSMMCVHIHAGCPCRYCKSMSVLQVHVHEAWAWAWTYSMEMGMQHGHEQLNLDIDWLIETILDRRIRPNYAKVDVCINIVILESGTSETVLIITRCRRERSVLFRAICNIIKWDYRCLWCCTNK